ncbi:MAG: hypothetical protein LBG66_02400 [Gallionellaceae bacterium]|nr:hypothetical protein [Gallionellaceae bacterium]
MLLTLKDIKMRKKSYFKLESPKFMKIMTIATMTAAVGSGCLLAAPAQAKPIAMPNYSNYCASHYGGSTWMNSNICIYNQARSAISLNPDVVCKAQHLIHYPTAHYNPSNGFCVS